MADNITLNSGSGGATLATDDAGAGGHVQIVKLALSANGSATPVTVDANGVLVNLGTNNDVTVTGTVTVDGSGVTQPVSGTVTANAGSGPWPVTDNSGSLTVDNTNIDNLHSSDFDTGAGTDTTPSIGIAVPAAGGAAVITGDATNGLDVDVTRVSGTVTVNGSGVTQPISAASLPLPTGAATAANQSTGNTALSAIQTAVEVIDNAIAGSEMQVDVVTLPNVTLAAGTNTNEVVGDVAHDAAAAGNPVLVAASSETMADSAPANRVSADADASRLSVTDGALYVIPTGPQTWSYHVDGSSALTDATVHAAPGAGLSLYVTDIVFSSGAATAINMFFEESTTKVLGPYYLEAVAGRGLNVHFQTPKKITANTALTVTTSAAIAHAVDVTGFIAPG